MFEVTKSIYYNEKRNFKKGKVESKDNGQIKNIDTPSFSEESTDVLAEKVIMGYNISMMDVVSNKVSVKLNGSSVVIKRYEMGDGTAVTDEQLGEWQGGKIDIFLGCYKHDIQKIERADIDFENVFAVTD
jgi:3D (Asp-Asp-Asp) domain-containing protein